MHGDWLIRYHEEALASLISNGGVVALLALLLMGEGPVLLDLWFGPIVERLELDFVELGIVLNANTKVGPADRYVVDSDFEEIPRPPMIKLDFSSIRIISFEIATSDL